MNPFTKTVRHGTTSYVAHVGTCNVCFFLQNQSLIKTVFAHRGIPEGLPLLKRGRGVLLSQVFERIQQKNFFKGVVSGGRGALGECGGVNNPIHYVRVKGLTRWIIDNIGRGSR